MRWRDTSMLEKQKVPHRKKSNLACHNPCDTNKNENLFSDTRLHKTTSSRQFVKIPAAMMRKSPIRRGFQPLFRTVGTIRFSRARPAFVAAPRSLDHHGVGRVLVDLERRQGIGDEGYSHLASARAHCA